MRRFSWLYAFSFGSKAQTINRIGDQDKHQSCRARHSGTSVFFFFWLFFFGGGLNFLAFGGGEKRVFFIFFLNFRGGFFKELS